MASGSALSPLVGQAAESHGGHRLFLLVRSVRARGPGTGRGRALYWYEMNQGVGRTAMVASGEKVGESSV